MEPAECERALNLLSARVDGEALDGADAAALDEHLSRCAECRAAAAAMRVQHEELVRAFAPRRAAAAAVAERVAAQVAPQDARVTPSPRPREEGRGEGSAAAYRPRFRWLPLFAAAAAGFVLAVVLFRPWEDHVRTVATTHPVTTQSVDPPTITRPSPAARLALATGVVELLSAGDTDWRPMPTGGEVAPGDRVRTGPKVRCEFVTADGSQVRLNSVTELQFRAPRALELARGQLWSSVAEAKAPFTVAVAQATVTALGTQFDLARAATEAEAEAEAETTLTVVEGATRVRDAAGSERVVNSGQALKIVGGRAGEASRVPDLVVATRWVHEILILKGRQDKELAERVDDLFAQIGQQKMSFLYEEEIRALGDHCVIPLARYVQSERSREDEKKRHTAARLLSDAAQPWSIPVLIELLRDRDGEVRFHAAEALRRLTGQDQGRAPQVWRDEPIELAQPALRKWNDWWEENKHRYPGAP